MGTEVVRHLVARLLESERITNCFCFKASECKQHPTLLDFSVEPLLAHLNGAKRLVPVTDTLPRPCLDIFNTDIRYWIHRGQVVEDSEFPIPPCSCAGGYPLFIGHAVDAVLPIRTLP